MTHGGRRLDPALVPEHLREVTVCTHGSIVGFAAAPAALDGIHVREIDANDPAVLDQWLAVHDAAYGERWGADEFRARIVEHPWFDIRHTYVASDDDGPLGIASAGLFRRNESVGIGHYLGVTPRARGRGVARALLARRYRALCDDGVTRAESHTLLGRTDALGAHFSAGFVPKTALDPWNPPPRPDVARFAEATEVLVELHRRWISAAAD